MSNYFYPLGMNSYNNNTPQGGYLPWKGNGVFSNPVGITSGNIRPLTNNDPSNNSNFGFGLPRPIKHYRKGRSVDANKNNMVSSSTGGSLIRQLIDTPGNSNIFQNPLNETSNKTQLTNACNTCKGIGIISEYAPTNNLTNIPSSTTQTLSFCCNDPKKAINRARSINTHINKKYYTSTQQYLNNRCHTFEQQQFNYLKSGDSTIKPGGPNSIYNNYVGNCNPNLVMDASYNTNPSGCKVTNYKPNNYNFASQGAVLSSDRTWKLNVNTINTNKANIRTLNLNKSKYFEGGST
jgi:hypothetical protein